MSQVCASRYLVWITIGLLGQGSQLFCSGGIAGVHILSVPQKAPAKSFKTLS
jgi:hypothetical protein